MPGIRDEERYDYKGLGVRRGMIIRDNKREGERKKKTQSNISY